jgi:hypothetical protein
MDDHRPKRNHLMRKRVLEWFLKAISIQVGSVAPRRPGPRPAGRMIARLNGARTPRRGVPTRKLLLRSTVVAVCGLLCGNLAQAEITVTPHYEEIAERGKVLEYNVQFGRQEFLLTPPYGWQFELSSDQNTLVFRSDSARAVFSVKFVENAPPRSDRELRALIEQRFPGAKNLESFTCIGRDREGRGVNTQFSAADGSSFENRLGLIRFEKTAVELSLTAPVEMIAKSHSAWTCVLNSLRFKGQ